MMGNDVKTKIFVSSDGKNYEQVLETKEAPKPIIPKLTDTGIIDDERYNKMAELGETEFSFKMPKDKYYLIYCRTKNRRIKKKQLKKMNQFLALGLGFRKYFKELKTTDIEIKVEGYYESK